MQKSVHITTPDCPLEEAAHLMLVEDIGCLPVMDDDKIVGIITDNDIFQSLVSFLGGDQAGARFTLDLPNKPGTLAKVAQTVANSGGNIVSVTTWDSKLDGNLYITIKEQGADYASLKQALADLPDVDIVDMRDNA